MSKLELHQDKQPQRTAPEPPEAIKVVTWAASNVIELEVRRHKFDIEPVRVLVPFHLLDVIYSERLKVAVNGMSGLPANPNPVDVCEMQLGKQLPN